MSQPDLRDEMRTTAHEPLLPIEKKLIAWSLGLGVTMLIILAIISRLYPVS